MFFNDFKSQIKFMNLPESRWILYLISTLPSDIATFIVQQPEETQENEKAKEMLL